MKFETELHGDVLLVRVKDTIFDVRGVKQFKRDVMLAITEAEPKIKNIAINLQNVRLLDSTGLGGLLFAKRQCDLKGGVCYLVDPQPRIRSLIKISKLEGIFKIVDRESDVLPEEKEDTDTPVASDQTSNNS